MKEDESEGEVKSLLFRYNKRSSRTNQRSLERVSNSDNPKATISQLTP